MFIGIDLGGTKIMTGAIDASGMVQHSPVIIPTGGTDHTDQIMDRLIGSVYETMSQLQISTEEVAGIGIGSTGPLSIREGVILDCPQLPTMYHFPLRKAFEEVFNLPVFLNNDANCLIYGETIFGAAKGKENVLGFTLGTGIGSAIILNRKIWNGSTETAGEVWTSPYKEGIIEDYISGAGVTKIYQSITGKKLSSLEVFQLAENGDPYALQTWVEFGEHLSVALSWSTNLFDPEMVVLGGSIAAAYPYFKTSLDNKYRKFLCEKPAAETKIVLAQLGSYAGFIGAACLALEDK